MGWAIICRKKDSMIAGNYFVYFEYLGRMEKTYVTKNVLNFLNVNELLVGDKVFILRSFNKQGIPIYLIKKLER